MTEDMNKNINAPEMKKILRQYLSAYAANADKPIEEWLNPMLKQSFPEESEEGIRAMSAEIQENVRVQNEKRASLDQAVAKGIPKEHWFANELTKATANMGAAEGAAYVNNIRDGIDTAQREMTQTITRSDGLVNMNCRRKDHSTISIEIRQGCRCDN